VVDSQDQLHFAVIGESKVSNAEYKTAAEVGLLLLAVQLGDGAKRHGTRVLTCSEATDVIRRGLGVQILVSTRYCPSWYDDSVLEKCRECSKPIF
jgi:hypothetical protein